MKSQQMNPVILGDSPLTLSDFIAIVRHGAEVKFSEHYVKMVNRSRQLVEKFLSEERIVYGMTTGFGSNSDKIIAPDDAVTLQKNILRSHACSVGSPLPEEVIRATMLMMLQNLGQGYSGVQLATLEQLRAFLNHRLSPFAPGSGSVGYLAVEAHISLVLIGEGRAYWNGELLEGSTALAQVGLKPIVLGCKEGLALVSGTTSPSALAALALYNAQTCALTADICGALSLEALKGTRLAFDPRLQSVRQHSDQIATAENLIRILADSSIAKANEHYRLQDALSLRAMPQLHGAVKKTLKDALVSIENEMNSCNDNPIIFPDLEDGIAMSGCNCDASYVGLASDSVCIAMTTLGKMSERRTDRLVNYHVSELPPFLIENPGLNSGFMITQYTAAGLLGEMRVLATPSSIDNTPTCANQEDYVSMGYNAAKKAYEASEKLNYLLAIELLLAAQAVEFHKPLLPAAATANVLSKIRAIVPHLETDRFIYPDIEAVKDLVHTRQIIEAVEQVTGPLTY